MSHEQAGGDVQEVVGAVEDVVGSDDDAEHPENGEAGDAEPMLEPPGADVPPLDGPDDEVDTEDAEVDDEVVTEVDDEADDEVDTGSDDADARPDGGVPASDGEGDPS